MVRWVMSQLTSCFTSVFWQFVSLCSQVFGLLLWIVCWTDLFYTFHELRQGHSQPPIYFVTPLVLGMTMVRIWPSKSSCMTSELLRRSLFYVAHQDNQAGSTTFKKCCLQCDTVSIMLWNIKQLLPPISNLVTVNLTELSKQLSGYFIQKQKCW